MDNFKKCMDLKHTYDVRESENILEIKVQSESSLETFNKLETKISDILYRKFPFIKKLLSLDR
jgi:hypothetical protein